MENSDISSENIKNEANSYYSLMNNRKPQNGNGVHLREVSPERKYSSERTAWDLYMNEMRRIPLITPEQEIEQAREIERAKILLYEGIFYLATPQTLQCLDAIAAKLQGNFVPSIVKRVEHRGSHRAAMARFHTILQFMHKLYAAYGEDSAPELAQGFEDLSLQYPLPQMLVKRLLTDPSNPEISVSSLNYIGQQLQHYEQAVAGLASPNLRLVIYTAKKFRGLGLPFEELVQEGNMGLLRGIDNFEYRRGYQFSTYASHWIRQGIRRALTDYGRTIRLPIYVNEKLTCIREVSKHLTGILKRPPSEEELAEHCRISLKKVQQFSQLGKSPLSLSRPFSEDSSFALEDILCVPSTSVEDEIDGKKLSSVVQQALEKLPSRQADILRMRFGIGRYVGEHTLEEIGGHYSRTRERIRQVEKKALARLQEDPELESFR